MGHLTYYTLEDWNCGTPQEWYHASEQANKACVAQDPEFATSWYNLADVQDAKGNTEEANRYWNASLKLDPNSQWVEFARRLLAMGR